MSKVIAYCGLLCSECPAFIATQKEDKKELEEVAKKWSTEEMKFKAEDILCDGCFSDKRIFSWCEQCDIRSCARKNNLESCAYCKDYTCELLNNVFGNDPSAKERLDDLRKNI